VDPGPRVEGIEVEGAKRVVEGPMKGRTDKQEKVMHTISTLHIVRPPPFVHSAIILIAKALLAPHPFSTLTA